MIDKKVQCVGDKPYKDTLLLPKTNFPMKKVLLNGVPDEQSYKVNAPSENQQQKKWDEADLYDFRWKMRFNSRPVVIHDGPPYANGDIHFGHVLNKVLKDITARWLSMSGYRVDFTPGWDCHGLPIEQKVLQDLLEENPNSVLVPKEIRQKCHAEAMKWVDAQRVQFKRLGICADWQGSYLTTNPAYEAKVLSVLSKLVQDNRVKRRLKPVHWCAYDATALAEAELEYKEIISDEVYVKFKCHQDFPNTTNKFHFIAWTTTPWTLPGNVALAVNPDIIYYLVGLDGLSDDAVVVSQNLVHAVMALKGWKQEQWFFRGMCKGSELVGLSYDGLERNPGDRRRGRVVAADYVLDTAGTGIVHVAPAHGVEDYLIAQQYKLPIINPVDSKGTYLQGTHPELDFKYVKSKNTTEKIITILSNSDMFWKRGKYSHSCPHCWRCKKPTITLATPQWFVEMDSLPPIDIPDVNHRRVSQNLRAATIAAVDKIEWVPTTAKNRISAMILNRPDWCISRQRVWGVEIPAMECLDCNQVFMDSKTIQLRIERGSDWWRTTKLITQSGIKCPSCSKLRLQPQTDILDVWFESGTSYNTVPTTEKTIVIEGTDQHRGWFQSSLMLGSAFKTIPFSTAITHGFVVDHNGKKLSKSDGTSPDVNEAIVLHGADPIRLLIASLDYTNDVKLFSPSGKGYKIHGIENIVEAYNKIRNTFRFILGNLGDHVPKLEALVKPDFLEFVDHYILFKTNELIKLAATSYNKFQFYQVYRFIHDFCVLELSGFYFDVIKDRLYADSVTSVSGRAARWTLVQIFSVLAKLIAPILPHLAEEVWDYTEYKESIHLTLAPEPIRIDWTENRWVSIGTIYSVAEFKSTWDVLLKVRAEILSILEALRVNKLIGSALQATVSVFSDLPMQRMFLAQHLETMRDICMVSEVTWDAALAEIGPGLQIEAKPVPTSYRRCQRCWKYDRQMQELCSRCQEVLNKGE